MTNKQSNEDGSISEAEAEWLQRRAQGGFASSRRPPAMSQRTVEAGGAFGVHSDAMVRARDRWRLRSIVGCRARWCNCSTAGSGHQILTGQPPVSASDWVMMME